MLSFRRGVIINQLIAYYRVSTDKQGKSGLGLEAQVAAVQAYAASLGLVVVASYQDIESGKDARPELAKALAHAKRIKATLVFAKLDRLYRNTRLLLEIVDSGADVVFCDFPNIPSGAMGRFMLTQMASVAELEAGLVSERTKAALAAYKARGGLLGASMPQCRNLTNEDRTRGGLASGKANKSSADDDYASMAEVIAQMVKLKDEGLTLRAIAARLTESGHTTRTGKPWNPTQVARVLKRTAKAV